MADDVFSAFGKGFVAFAHTRAADLVGDSFSDTGTLIDSLADGKQGTTKTAFEAVKADVQQLVGIGEALKDAIDKQIDDAKAAVTEMATELGADPFQADELARALTALGKLLIAYDQAIDKIAEKVSEKASGSMTADQIKQDISGMNAPIRKVLADVGGAVTSNFDTLVKTILNIDSASDELGKKLVWNYAEKRLHIEFLSVSGASQPPLQFDGGSIVAFFTYKTEFKAGIEIKTKLKAGLRGDKFLEKIMPAQAPTADADQVAITLDTKDGLTFGSGKDKRLVLPVRFAFPGFEIRELAVEQPAQDNEKGKNRVNVVMTMAGKMGDVFAVVAEGGGVSIRWNDGADPSVEPKLPTGIGMRLKTPAVSGGGYVRYDEVKKEFGGVFQLEMLKIGVTAIGLLTVEPLFSMVIVIGVRFSPKIDLGFGFTLSGLGGILAINRRLDSDALRDGLKDGIVGQLLFPADPVASAPQILNKLSQIFPVQEGAFVIGPIAELGWGSQAGFVKARLGVVICLPDPKLVLLGAVQIGVPSADVDEKLRVVDLRAEIFGEITPEYFFLKVSLAKSKIMKLEVTGDICLFIQWAGEGAFVLSVGGFFPGYEAPKQIGKMDRVGIKFAPPVDWISLSAQAYVAITSNSIQFGGRIELKAKVGPASAEAWIQLDAMFRWAPYFYFVMRIDAGIRVKAFGVSVAGVTFVGELSGDKPFKIEGRATVEILFWDVSVDIGPLTWGEARPAPAPEINPISTAAAALSADAAWVPLLPPDAQSIVQLAALDNAALYHPMGQIELRQISVPMETDIDRIGSSKVTCKRINLREATLGGADAGAIWPLTDRFPPGHFLELKDHEVLARPEYEEHASGLGMGASKGPNFSAAVHSALSWKTVLPGETQQPSGALRWTLIAPRAKILRAAMKQRGINRANPYAEAPAAPGNLPVGPAVQPVAVAPRGIVQVVSAQSLQVDGAILGVALSDGTLVDGLAMPASDAASLVRLGRAQGKDLTTVAAGLV